MFRIYIVSDIHYAGRAEQGRGDDYETKGLGNPIVRLFLRLHRRYLWLRDPLRQGSRLLERFVAEVKDPDLVVGNGDFSCNTASVGLCDPAAYESAAECLGTLRKAFGEKFRGVIGDHELGKFSFAGQKGGLRIASYGRSVNDLGLDPFWEVRNGRYVLMGVTSSLLALPNLHVEGIPEEMDRWRELRAQHMERVNKAFGELKPGERVILFCHDPTGLPYLLELPAVRERVGLVSTTVIGHLHSNLILGMSRLLAGIPRISFMGNTARRLSEALRRARDWKQFNVRLCPAIAGIELLKDGGYLVLTLDQASENPKVEIHPLPRR